MRIIKLLTSILIFLAISFALGYLLLTKSGEKMYLVFIPIFWLFYLPVSWGVWTEGYYTEDFDINKMHKGYQQDKGLFLVICYFGYIIIQFIKDARDKK